MRRRRRGKPRHGDRRHGGAGGRHARLDRDPAALARAGLARCPTGSARASPPTATSSPSATAPSCRSMPSASAIRRRSTGLDVGACVSGQIEIVDEDDLANSLTIQEGVLPSALAPILPALFIPNGRLLGALKSLVAGVYKGPFASLQTFFAVSHDSASGRLVLEDDRIALAWPGAKDEPVYRRLDAALEALVRQVGRQLRQEPAGRHHDGPAAGDRASARRLRHGPRARRRASSTTSARCSTGAPGAGSTDVHDGLYVIDGVDHAALAGRQSAAHHHGARRARHAAPGARPRPRVRRRARAATRRRSRQWRRAGDKAALGSLGDHCRIGRERSLSLVGEGREGGCTNMPSGFPHP